MLHPNKLRDFFIGSQLLVVQWTTEKGFSVSESDIISFCFATLHSSLINIRMCGQLGQTVALVIVNVLVVVIVVVLIEVVVLVVVIVVVVFVV